MFLYEKLFLLKTCFKNMSFVPEMMFFLEKKPPAAKLSHKQSKFSASPQDGIGHKNKKEKRIGKMFLHVQTALCMSRKERKMKKVCFPSRNKKK